MGIEPAEPGFGKVIVRPQLASLENASIKLPTIRGDISLTVENRPSQPYSLELTLPANVAGIVYVPVFGSTHDKVIVDGVEITASRKDGWLIVNNIGSGRHTITRHR